MTDTDSTLTAPLRNVPPTLKVEGSRLTRNFAAQHTGQQYRWEISCTNTAGVRFTGAMVAHVEWRWRTLTMFTTAAGNLIIIEGIDGSTGTGWQTKAYMESSASRLAELVGRDHLLRELFDKAGIADILEVP